MFLVLAHEFAWCVLMLKMNDVSMDRFEKNEAGVSGTRVVLLHGGHACFVEAERCSHVEVPHFQECLSCCIQNMGSLFVHLCPVVGHPRQHACVHLAAHVLCCRVPMIGSYWCEGSLFERNGLLSRVTRIRGVE